MDSVPDRDSANVQVPAHPAVTLDFIKSNYFRVVYSDGVWGGVTPGGDVHVAFWNERPAIPKKMVFSVTPEGNLGEELQAKREVRDGLVREVEVSVVMRLQTAKAFQGWLQTVIAAAENAPPDKPAATETDR